MNSHTTISAFPEANGPEEFSQVLDWFGIGQDDTVCLASLREAYDKNYLAAIEGFYVRVKESPWANAKFGSDDVINRVKLAQAKYFREILDAKIDERYLRERRRIGQVHEQAGIGPTLYIGAYSYYMSFLGEAFLGGSAPSGEAQLKHYLAFQKIAMLDMALALETYIEKREAAIAEQERQLSELPTPVLKL